MKALIPFLPFLVPLTWGLGGFFGGLHSRDIAISSPNNTGLEGLIFIGLGYILWGGLAIFMTGGNVLSGLQWRGSSIAFGLTFSLGGLLFPLAMKYSPPTDVVAYSALYPAVAAILAFVFLHQALPIQKIIAIAFIVFGGWLLA